MVAESRKGFAFRSVVRLTLAQRDGAWRAAMPGDALQTGRDWRFDLPQGGIEPLLRRLIEADAGIDSLSIERPGLHDAFVAIAGAAEAARLEEASRGELA